MKQNEVKFLKFFVYSMGIALIGCALFMSFVVYKKLFADIVPQATEKGNCAPFIIKVEQRITDVHTDGERISVVLRDESGDIHIKMHDSCNGNLINEVTIKQVEKESSIELESQTHEGA